MAQAWLLLILLFPGSQMYQVQTEEPSTQKCWFLAVSNCNSTLQVSWISIFSNQSLREREKKRERTAQWKWARGGGGGGVWWDRRVLLRLHFLSPRRSALFVRRSFRVMAACEQSVAYFTVSQFYDTYIGQHFLWISFPDRVKTEQYNIFNYQGTDNKLF